MEGLNRLLHEPDLDPYIIMLARDPRGIFNSRDKIFTSDLYKEQDRSRNYKRLVADAKLVCKQTKRMVDYTNSMEALGNKTLLVRYEDLAMAPLVQAERIYQHVGLPFPDQVRDWIEHKLSIETTEHENDETFDTMKNPHDVALRWRSEINVTFVDVIEKSCAASMKQLGYIATNGNHNNLTTATVLTHAFP